MISKLGTNERINVIIGSSLVNRSEKSASIYNYSDGTIEKTFSSAYSFIDITDLDADENNELLLLTSSASGHPAVADSYKLDENGIYHKYSRELSGSFTEFDSIVYGDIGEGITGLYIDAFSGSGLIQTDIIYMNSSGLNKVFETPEESQSTIRPAGCSTFDVDGDGILEIPVQTISPGYENVSESEQMKFTSWLYLDGDMNLKQKYSSYFSINDGYIFIFPEKWFNNVTVKRDTINDEIVFCAYENGKAEEELLRVFYAEDSASREDRISSGYMLMHTAGESAFLAYIPPDSSEHKLSITAAEAAVYFKFKA